MESLGTALSTAIVGGDVLARTSIAAHDSRIPTGQRRIYAAKTATNSLADWGVFILAASVMNKVLDSTIDRFETTRRFRENHPVATYLGTFAAVVYTAQYVANKASNFVAHILNQNTVDEFFHNTLNTPTANRFIERVRPSMQKIARTLSKPKVLFLGNIGLIGLITGLLAYTSGKISAAKQQNDVIKHISENYTDFSLPADDGYVNKPHRHHNNRYQQEEYLTPVKNISSDAYELEALKKRLGLRPGDKVIVIDKSDSSSQDSY